MVIDFKQLNFILSQLETLGCCRLYTGDLNGKLVYFIHMGPIVTSPGKKNSTKEHLSEKANGVIFILTPKGKTKVSS